jgi:hypothetical protein
MMILFGSSYDTSDGRVLARTGIGTKVIQMTGVRPPRGASIMLKCGVPFVATGIEVTSFRGSVIFCGAGVAVDEADHDFGPLCVFSASASGPHPAFHR